MGDEVLPASLDRAVLSPAVDSDIPHAPTFYSHRFVFDLSDDPVVREIQRLAAGRVQTMEILEQTGWIVNNVPRGIFKMPSIAEMSSAFKGVLVRLVDRCVRKLCSVLFPKDHDSLYKEYLKKKAYQSRLIRRMVIVFKLARKGSVEKRVIRACLFSSLPGSVVFRLLDGIDVADTEDLLSVSSSDELDEDYAARVEEIMRLCSDSDATDDERLVDGSQPSSTRAAQPRCRNGHVSRTQKAGRDDWMMLLKDGFLRTHSSGRRRFDDCVIQHLVRFVFRADNAQLMAWGTKRLKLKGQYHRFPAVRRKGSLELLYEKYNLELGLNSGAARVGRTLFIRIVGVLTCGQVKERSSVDYYQHALVFENMNNVMDMVATECTSISGEDLRDLRRACDGMTNFIKYMYTSHLALESDDPSHSIDFALYGDSDERKQIRCDHCCSPFRFMAKLRGVVGSSNGHFNQVLDDAEERLQLYMGHKLRGHVQDTRLQEILGGLKHSKPQTEVVVILDFKMKYIPKRFREPSSLWFAQCGMSWHGAGVFFRKDSVAIEAQREMERRMWESRRRTRPYTPKQGRQEDEDEYGECKIDVFFTDHIVENTAVEDTLMVVQIIDALCYRIKEQLPLVEKMTIVSDNAGCYKNNLFTPLAHVVAAGHGIEVVNVFRNVAQNTKTVLDGHHSVSSRHVDKFIRETGCEVVVPSDLVHALTYAGGVKNSTTDFINVDRQSALVKRWVELHAKHQVAAFGKRKEFKLERKSVRAGGRIHDVVHIRAFTFSNSDPDHFIQSDNNVKSWDIETEEIEEVVQRNSIEPLPPNLGENGKKRRGRPRKVHTVLEEEDIVVDEDEPGGDTLSMVDGDGPDLNGGASQQNGYLDFTQCANIFKGKSGVTLKFMSGIQPWDRRLHLDFATVMEDTVAEMEVEGQRLEEITETGHADSQSGESDNDSEVEEAVEGCSAAVGSRSRTEVEKARHREEVLDMFDVSMMNNSRGSESFQCDLCRKVYRHKSSLTKHRLHCFGNDKESDAMSRAIQLSLEGYYEGNALQIYSKDDDNPFTQDCSGTPTTFQYELEGGWALPARHGMSLGRQNIAFYKRHIEEWKRMTRASKDSKMTASMMRRALKATYPHRYDIPIEVKLRRLVSGKDSLDETPGGNEIVGSQSEADSSASMAYSQLSIDLDITKGSGKTNNYMKKEYADEILSIIVDEPMIKRASIRDRMIVRLGLNPGSLPTDFPNKDRCVRKYSNFLNTLKGTNGKKPRKQTSKVRGASSHS